jgi:ABC-type branched-subunit amino acid transport system substrate-binding protein
LAERVVMLLGVDGSESRQAADRADEGPGPSLRRPHGRLRRGRAAAALSVAAIFLMLVAAPVLFDEPTVKIGVLVPLTGSYSFLTDVRDGMILAVEKLNRWGGMNGAHIELLIRDTESDPDRAVEAFAELEREERPLFYVSSVSHLTTAVIPQAEEAEVVLVGVVAASQNLTQGSHWCVRYYSDAGDEVNATMHSLDVLGATDVGILHGTDDFSSSVNYILTEALEDAGMSHESVPLAALDGDYSEEVSQVLDREAVFLGMPATYIRETLLQLREDNYTGHVLTASGGTSTGVRLMPEAEGVYVAAPAMYNENYLPAKWIAEEFQTRYGRPLTHYATCGYDVIYLFSGLMRDVDLTRANVHNALEGGFVYSGTTATLVVDPGSHDIGFDLLSAMISEGRLRYL